MLIFSDFILKHKGGEGDSGVVWKAVDKHGFTCAVKILRELALSVDSSGVPQEASILETLSDPGHPNIVKYYGWGTVKKDELDSKYCCFGGVASAFIVMGWVDGITLQEADGQVVEMNKRIILFKKLLEAVIYIHSKTVVHRGILWSNIIISKEANRVTLCGFGSSSFFVPSNDNTSPRASIAVDGDCCQCGTVLLSLFVNFNSNKPELKLMQHEAIALAKELVDLKSELTLQTALTRPLLTKDSVFEKRFQPSEITHFWDDFVFETVKSHLVEMCDQPQLKQLSFVCKQFYISFQHVVDCQFKLPPPTNFGRSYEGLHSQEEFNLWLQCVSIEPYIQDWDEITGYSSADVDFELELLIIYLECLIDQSLHLKTSTSGALSEATIRDLCLYLDSVFANATCIGAFKLYHIGHAGYSRCNLALNQKDQPAERKIFMRIFEALLDGMSIFCKQVLQVETWRSNTSVSVSDAAATCMKHFASLRYP